MHTRNKLETEVGTRRISRTWTTSSARKPKLKWWAIRPGVLIFGTDLNDGVTRRSVLIDHRTIVHRKLREIIIHVHQMYDQRASAGLCRCSCLALHTQSHSHTVDIDFERTMLLTVINNCTLSFHERFDYPLAQTMFGRRR